VSFGCGPRVFGRESILNCRKMAVLSNGMVVDSHNDRHIWHGLRLSAALGPHGSGRGKGPLLEARKDGTEQEWGEMVMGRDGA
jgi:hypothetical protein